jgi:hypothetical protein
MNFLILFLEKLLFYAVYYTSREQKLGVDSKKEKNDN